MAHEHRFIFLSINLVKIHNTPQIGGLTTINRYFREKRKQQKFQTFLTFIIYYCKMQLCIKKSIFLFLNFFLKIYVLTPTKILKFSVNVLYTKAYTL